MKVHETWWKNAPIIHEISWRFMKLHEFLSKGQWTYGPTQMRLVKVHKVMKWEWWFFMTKHVIYPDMSWYVMTCHDKSWNDSIWFREGAPGPISWVKFRRIICRQCQPTVEGVCKGGPAESQIYQFQGTHIPVSQFHRAQIPISQILWGSLSQYPSKNYQYPNIPIWLTPPSRSSSRLAYSTCTITNSVLNGFSFP